VGACPVTLHPAQHGRPGRLCASRRVVGRAIVDDEDGQVAARAFDDGGDPRSFLVRGDDRDDIRHAVIILITFGELAIGIGLLVGALVGIAAFCGALMNMSFLLAGSASVNPILFTFAIGLMLAWKVAGYYGVDRYLLPRLGVPWHSAVSTGGPLASRAPAG